MEALFMYKPGLNPNSHKNKRRYNVDDNFFETPNEINCYYAGFIAADGCIRKYCGKVGSAQLINVKRFLQVQYLISGQEL